MKDIQSVRVESKSCVSGLSKSTYDEVHLLNPWLQALEKPLFSLFLIITNLSSVGTFSSEPSDELLSIMKTFSIVILLDLVAIDCRHFDK